MKLLKSMKYSLYICVRPFDGFWDLKHEKRGTAAGALGLLFLTVLSFVFRFQLTGFEFNENYGEQLNLLTQVMLVVIPVVLWCVTNWSVTTLMDGEGSMGDVFKATAYALAPLIIVNIFNVVLSNVISIDEIQIYQFLEWLSYVWTGFLLIIGLMTVHRFTVLKTIMTMILVVVGILIICFLTLLFFVLLQQMLNFGTLLVRELFLQYG